MGYGDLQFYDIIIFAAIAVFLVFRLRNVLGKRTGNIQNKTKSISSENKKNTEEFIKKEIPELEEKFSKLVTAYKTMEEFDHKSFINGAKLAFETIINAFNQSDKNTLKGLVSKDVYAAFEGAINENKTEPDNQFFSLNVEKIENVVVQNNIIKITIIFVSEQFRNNDESTVVKKQDSWTFEKSVKSNNPNWLLSAT